MPCNYACGFPAYVRERTQSPVWTFLNFPWHAQGMEDTDLGQLGQRIRRIRQARRLTQEELGFMVGVSGRTVGNWERGANSPLGSLGALEDVLGVDDLLADVISQDDPVTAAIERSDLSRADKATLIGTYYRMLDATGGEGSMTMTRWGSVPQQ